MLPLNHVASANALEGAEKVWKATVEPRVDPDVSKNLPPTIEQLANVHPEENHSSGLNRHERFRVWKYLEDLVKDGPAYFRKFCQQLGNPEMVEAIPIKKTTQIPMAAMDVKPSSPGENGDALKKIFQQSGVGDPKDTIPGTKDPKDTIILVCGDLLTGQHLQSLIDSRSAEDTSWRQLKNVNFNLGLFHLKMACADTIYKTFIVPKDGRLDKTSLMALVALLRPKETGKIESNPGFRRMHEVILHVGTALRLDVWRLAALSEDSKLEDLEAFASTKPTWESLVSMAQKMVRDYSSPRDMKEYRETCMENERDMQHENVQIMHTYFLWYEEMTWALNHGDIGRVESLFGPWMFIFRGCGKHKYAAEMRRYLETIHFIYPKELSQAIRMNILCNPTGKKDGFRGIDWLVEHNNLYIKRIYGGKYSNHQKERIITKSVLIELYKRVRLQFETMFRLDHKTTRHTSPDMAASFRQLMAHIAREKANKFIKGRTTNYEVPDVMEKGMSVIL
ncbi:hypothetical protein C0991_003753 [Blastosporella zonata]|nr:hypothetical protein C0991_003753 [Blastosporella zonata]